MKKKTVAVIGCGFVGAFTALRISREGVKVTIFETQAEICSVVSSKALGGITPFSDDHIRADLPELSKFTVENFLNEIKILEKVSGNRIRVFEAGLIYGFNNEVEKKKINELYEADGINNDRMRFVEKDDLGSLCGELSNTDLDGALIIDDEFVVDCSDLIVALSIAVDKSDLITVRFESEITQLAEYQNEIELTVFDKKLQLETKERFDFNVVCTGIGCTKLFPKLEKDIVPVKGEAFELQTSAIGVTFGGYHIYGKIHPVIADKPPTSCYLVPSEDGRCFLGITYVKGDTSEGINLARCIDVLSAAKAISDDADNWLILRTWSGIRPSTKDGLPLIGCENGNPRTIFATCHFGVGLTLGPATAELVCKFIGLASDMNVSQKTLQKISPSRWHTK